MVNERSRFHLLEVGLTMPPETFLGWKLEGLAARGVRVTVSAASAQRVAGFDPRGVELIPAPRWDETGVQMLTGLAIDLVRVAASSPSKLRATIDAALHPIRDERGRRLTRFLFRLRSYLPLALAEPDVVHFEWNSAAIHYLPMGRVWSCPTVVSCHGSDTNLRPYAPGAHDYVRWLRESFERVTTTHCVSDAVAEEAAELGMDARRAWLIHPAVDPVVFSPPDDRSDPAGRPLRVVSVGDFRWLKGHEYSLRVVARLLRDGVPVKLEILGGDPSDAVDEDSDRQRIERAIEREALRDHVTLFGKVGFEIVRDRLRGADVLLHSSLTEGVPNCVLEAMACGLPVVVSDCGGVSEAVRDGVEGFVVPLRGVGEAADALRTLAAEPALRTRMGQAGRARVQSHFSLDAQLDDFLAMYRSLLDGVDRSTLPPRVAGEPQLRLLSVGPMSRSQGFEDAIEAVQIVRRHGVDCRLRVFGTGRDSGALWFTRRQLELERCVELRDDEELSRVCSSPQLRSTQLQTCAQWHRQLRWADVLVDAALYAPPPAVAAAARAAGIQVVSVRADPAALADELLAIAYDSPPYGGPPRPRISRSQPDVAGSTVARARPA